MMGYPEIGKNKQIIIAMIERNFKGKYGNGYIRIWWNFIAPVLLILAVYFVFISIKEISLDSNFWIYLSSSIFCVTFCSGCLRGRALVNNSNYIKKMAIPRWIPIFADVVSQFIILLISYIIMMIAMFACGHGMDVSAILFLPLELVLLFIFAFGLSMAVSVLSVVSYDFGYFVMILSRIVIWLTPTFFTLDDVNDTLVTATFCNPFTYFVETFHHIFYYVTPPDLWFVGMSALFAAVFLIAGVIIFRLADKKLADVI